MESDKEALDKKLVARAQKPSSLPSPSPGYEENEKLTQAPSGLNGDTKTDGPNENAEASESDMSEVLDEAPKRKSRSRKSGSAKPKAKKTDSAKGKKAAEMSTDPDAEEIKRLQSWLVRTFCSHYPQMQQSFRVVSHGLGA